MMLDLVGSPALNIVYDAPNLLDLDGYDPPMAAEVITRDIATLGPHIALAHAKELIAHRAPAARSKRYSWRSRRRWRPAIPNMNPDPLPSNARPG